jgi:hypothetical protein
MLAEPTKIKKTDVVNGAIRLLAVKYDTDWMPMFHNKRSLKNILKWMQLNKMKRIDLVILNIAYKLTYDKK